MRDVMEVRDARGTYPPGTATAQSIWSRLEGTGRISASRALGAWDSETPDDTYCERFWELLPDGEDRSLRLTPPPGGCSLRPAPDSSIRGGIRGSSS